MVSPSENILLYCTLPSSSDDVRWYHAYVMRSEVNILNQGMSPWVGKSGTVWGFIMLFRMANDFKLTSYLFLEFPCNIFWPWLWVSETTESETVLMWWLLHCSWVSFLLKLERSQRQHRWNQEDGSVQHTKITSQGLSRAAHQKSMQEVLHFSPITRVFLPFSCYEIYVLFPNKNAQ